MSNWFKDLKEQTNTFIENFKGEEEMEKETGTATKTKAKTDKAVENYRNTLQSPQRSLSETVPMRKDTTGMTVNKSTNVKVMEPKNNDDAFVVVDNVRAGDIVLMKLEKAEGNAPETILNIVYGACHYANIMPEKVGPMMLLIDPKFKTR
jgi:FtsZ-interacting cell division protein YlmF